MSTYELEPVLLLGPIHMVMLTSKMSTWLAYDININIDANGGGGLGILHSYVICYKLLCVKDRKYQIFESFANIKQLRWLLVAEKYHNTITSTPFSVITQVNVSFCWDRCSSCAQTYHSSRQKSSWFPISLGQGLNSFCLMKIQSHTIPDMVVIFYHFQHYYLYQLICCWGEKDRE